LSIASCLLWIILLRRRLNMRYRQWQPPLFITHAGHGAFQCLAPASRESDRNQLKVSQFHWGPVRYESRLIRNPDHFPFSLGLGHGESRDNILRLEICCCQANTPLLRIASIGKYRRGCGIGRCAGVVELNNIVI
jgi:hypothetical protein